jgi:hypothetical protein
MFQDEANLLERPSFKLHVRACSKRRQQQLVWIRPFAAGFLWLVREQLVRADRYSLQQSGATAVHGYSSRHFSCLQRCSSKDSASVLGDSTIQLLSAYFLSRGHYLWGVT